MRIKYVIKFQFRIFLLCLNECLLSNLFKEFSLTPYHIGPPTSSLPCSSSSFPEQPPGTGELTFSPVVGSGPLFTQSHFCNLVVAFHCWALVRLFWSPRRELCSCCTPWSALWARQLLPESWAVALPCPGPTQALGDLHVLWYLGRTPIWAPGFGDFPYIFKHSSLHSLLLGLAWYLESLSSHQSTLRDFWSLWELFSRRLMALTWNWMSNS